MEKIYILYIWKMLTLYFSVAVILILTVCGVFWWQCDHCTYEQMRMHEAKITS